MAVLLNIGCGRRFHPEWVNLDLYAADPSVIVHDITQPLPFGEDHFDVVYHSHVLEHMSRHDAQALLHECYRVLKPQGRLRVVLPDLEHSARLYLEALEAVLQRPSSVEEEHYEWAVLNLLDQLVRTTQGGAMLELLSRPHLEDLDYIVENAGGEILRHLRHSLLNPTPKAPIARPALWRRLPQALLRRVARRYLPEYPDTQALEWIAFKRQYEVHLWMYDRYSLAALLKSIGFEQLEVLSPTLSGIPEWERYQLDVSPEGVIYKPQSLCLEAVKPN